MSTRKQLGAQAMLTGAGPPDRPRVTFLNTGEVLTSFRVLGDTLVTSAVLDTSHARRMYAR